MTSLRSLLFTSYLYLIIAILGLVLSPSLLLGRSLTLKAARLWANLVIGGLRIICGTKFEIRGLENIPKGPAIIASKHQAMWETVSYFKILNDPAYVIKRELSLIPVYGWYCKKLKLIAVDRDAHAKALRSMVRQAQECIADNRSIVIFPEGTRTQPGTTLDYKPGTAAIYRQLNVPCVPVALNSGLYWRRGKPKRQGTIIVEFLPAIEPGLKRQEFMNQLRDKIETASNRLYKEGCQVLNEPEPATAAQNTDLSDTAPIIASSQSEKINP